MEQFSENTGHPVVAFLLPFSFPVEETAQQGVWTGIEDNAAVTSYTSQDVLVGRMPTNDRLRQFFMEDCDEYSQEYLLAHPYCRVAIENAVQLEDFHAQVTLSVRREGHGSVIMITQSEKSHTLADLLQITKVLQSKLQAENCSQLRALLYQTLGKALSVNAEDFKIGKPYPFYDFYDEGGNVPAVQEFVHKNYRELYGVLHQDVTGWQRTKEELARGFLAEDLSRRNEYAFYISQVASVEIDDEERMNSVCKWAAEQNVSVSFLQTKLILERILVLETLVMQKHLLLCICDTVEQILKQKKPKYMDILAMQMQVTKDLCDFHLIRSQDEHHVSGVEWREYGQKQFGLEKLYNSLMTRISLIESITKESEAADMARKTFVISVFSFALSLSTIITICEWLFSAPFLQMTTGSIVWYVTSVALVMISVIMLIWYQGDRYKKKRKNRK